MAIINTVTSWGIAVSCTGGTAAATRIVAKGTKVNVAALCFSGSAADDIVTVLDDNGVQIAKSAAISAFVSFGKGAIMDGIQVSCAGGTNGSVAVVYA
jgi:hypothetical protein